MKQHITVEQLKELSNESKQKILKWWKPKTGDVYTTRWGNEICTRYWVGRMWRCGGYDLKSDKGVYPLLSIGQMIKFLMENKKGEFTIKINPNTIRTIPMHHNLHEPFWLAWGEGEVYNGNHELCDALWEAVKEVLKEEK